MEALGLHILLELFGCDARALNDKKALEKIFVHTAKESNAVVLETAFHKFNPHGISGVVIIAESHFAVHTWPEYGYAAVDIFSCGKKMDYEKAVDLIKKAFSPTHMTTIALKRGVLFKEV